MHDLSNDNNDTMIMAICVVPYLNPLQALPAPTTKQINTKGYEDDMTFINLSPSAANQIYSAHWKAS